MFGFQTGTLFGNYKMNSELMMSLIGLARVPDENIEQWIGGAREGVDFLQRCSRNHGKIFLYATGPHLFIHSLLVPISNVRPLDHDDLDRAHLMISDNWRIQRTLGGGADREIYLEPPLSYPGCNTLVGGEKLIFWRNFEGVKDYRPTVEISQKLVHSLDLYYMDERRAYSRLDGNGDFEDIITVFDDELSDPWQHVRAIAISSHDLATYMALSGTALVTKFDFTRTLPGHFSGWSEHDAQIFQLSNLH